MVRPSVVKAQGGGEGGGGEAAPLSSTSSSNNRVRHRLPQEKKKKHENVFLPDALKATGSSPPTSRAMNCTFLLLLFLLLLLLLGHSDKTTASHAFLLPSNNKGILFSSLSPPTCHPPLSADRWPTLTFKTYQKAGGLNSLSLSLSRPARRLISDQTLPTTSSCRRNSQLEIHRGGSYRHYFRRMSSQLPLDLPDKWISAPVQ